jgi:hypothetical protein
VSYPINYQLLVTAVRYRGLAHGDDNATRTDSISTSIVGFDSPVLANEAYNRIIVASRSCEIADFHVVKLYAEE